MFFVLLSFDLLKVNRFKAVYWTIIQGHDISILFRTYYERNNSFLDTDTCKCKEDFIEKINVWI